MRRNALQRWVSVAIVLTVVSLAGLWWHLPSYNLSLLSHATWICRSAGWQPLGSRYQWVSDHELLALLPVNPGNQVIRVNVRTGTQESLPALQQTAAQLTPAATFNAIPSPDGRWMLFFDTVGMHPEERHTAVSLDGTHQIQWSCAGTYSEAAWAPNSQWWAELTNPKPSDSFSPQSVFEYREIRIHGVVGAARTIRVALNPGAIGIPQALNIGVLIGVTDEEHMVIVSDLNLPGDRRLLIDDLKIRPTPIILHEFSLPKSDDGAAGGFTLSPDGRRLAWTVSATTTPPPATLADRCLAFLGLHRPPAKQTQLWTSGLDGADRHEVGYADTTYARPESFHWLPDSRRLSFVYQTALWTVSAD